MGPGSYLDDSESVSVGSGEVLGGLLYHNLPNLMNFSPDDNRTLDTHKNSLHSQGDFDPSEMNLTATTHSTISAEHGSLSTTDTTTTFHKTGLYIESFDRRNITEDNFRDANETLSVFEQTQSTTDDLFFKRYKDLIQAQDFKTESVQAQTSSYNVTLTNSTEFLQNYFQPSELTTESVVNLTNSPYLEATPFQEVNDIPVFNLSSKYLVLPVNISNISEKVTGLSMMESLSNSNFNSSFPNDLNTSLVYSNNFSSGDPTSFTFDLTSWLTLTPSNTADDWLDTPGRVGNEATLVLKVLLLSFISLVGCLGNILVIWSVIKERRLHRPPFYFLLSFGVTDLSRAVFCVPVVITTVLHGSRWRHGESACKLFAFATSFFVFSSVLSLLAIAIDRHICVVYSKIYRRRAPGIANLVVAIIIWIVAFSISFPPVLGVGEYVFVPEETQCAYHHKHYTITDSVSTVIIFVAILLVAYFLYFRIFRFMRAHRRMRPLQHNPALSSNWAFIGPGANGQAFINWLNGFGGQVPIRQGGQRSVQRLNFGRVVNLSITKNEHLTRLFLILTVVFGITWLPYIILSIWRIFFDTRALHWTFVTTSAWLGHGQVALCPVVYFIARGSEKKPARTVYSHAEKRSFLLENKARK